MNVSQVLFLREEYLQLIAKNLLNYLKEKMRKKKFRNDSENKCRVH